MENTDKNGNEAFLYGVKVFEGQLAFVELTVEKYLLYDVLYMGLQPAGSRLL